MSENTTIRVLSPITGKRKMDIILDAGKKYVIDPVTGGKQGFIDPETPIGGADVSGVTATAADVDAAKKFVTSDGTLTDGTLTTVIQPAPTLTFDSTTRVVTASYTPLAGRVKDTSAKSATLQLPPHGGNTVLLMHFNSSLEREGQLAAGGIVTERINSMDAEMGGGAESWTPTFDTGKFGNAILFDGSNQSEDPEGPEEWYNHRLILPVSADILTDDFTIEFWYKAIDGWDNNGAILGATSTCAIMFDARGVSGTTQGIDTGIGNGTSWMTATSIASISPTINTWHHVAFVRNGNTCIVYIDGAQNRSFDCSSFSAMTKNALLCLGRLDSRFYGLVEELRVSKIARYTSTFTPPASAFTVD